MSERDHELGAALRQLDVPEHRPGFYAALEDKLQDAARDDGVVRQPVRLRPRRRPPTHRPAARRLAAAAAAVIAVAVAVTVVVGGPRGSNTIDVATAAEVRRIVAQAWSSAESVAGTLVVSDRRQHGPERRRWKFILTEDGDVRMSDVTRGGEVAYDADRNVERSLSVSESIPGSDVLFASVRRGLAPGWPDPNPADELLDHNLGSVVRALVAGGDSSVQEVTYQGRDAWLLETDIRLNLIVPDDSPNHLSVTVDQQTGFPVRVVASHEGRRLWATRVENLTVNAPVPDNAFWVRFPPGAEVFRTDAGFHRVPLEDVEARVGYAPLLPSDVPPGYELDSVFVSNEPSLTGTEGGNPPVADIVSAVYRRGLDQFLVTTRPTGGDRARWDDPLATGEGYVDDPESVTFSAGALAREHGELLIDPLATPHVWAATEQLVVTVSGDLTRRELLDVAESLAKVTGNP